MCTLSKEYMHDNGSKEGIQQTKLHSTTMPLKNTLQFSDAKVFTAASVHDASKIVVRLYL
jgi:exopolysaccharide biosynthesis protein